jgi:myosin heavy subunit
MAYNLTEQQLSEIQARTGTRDLSRTQFNIQLQDGTIIPAGINPGQGATIKLGGEVMDRSTAQGSAIASQFVGQGIVDPAQEMAKALKATPLSTNVPVNGPASPSNLLTSGTVQGQYKGKDIFAGTDAQVQAQMSAIDSGSNQLGQQDQLASMLQTVKGMQKQVETTPTSSIPSTVDGSKIAPTPTIPNIPTPTSTTDIYYGGLAKQVADLTTKLETERQTQQTALDTKNADLQKQLNDIKTLQSEGMLKQGSLVAEEASKKKEQLDLEIARFNENYDKVQGLATQLSDLTTTGNEIIAQQKAVTGLSSIRNPRISQTISDITAQSGVIQAAISTYNGQMNQAQNQLQSANNAISDIYKDQIDYYDTIYNYYQDQKGEVSDLKADVVNKQADLAKEKSDAIKTQLDNAQKTYNMIASAMTSPESALFMAEAGVTLNDTIEQINTKIALKSKLDTINDKKNQLLEEGYEFVPFPSYQSGQDMVTFNVEGQNLTFKRPVSTAKTTTIPSTSAISSGNIESEIGGDLFAYASQYADTGKLPIVTELKNSGINVGQVSSIAKQLPKPNGAIVSTNTGVPSTKMSSTQESAITALSEIVNTTIPAMQNLYPELYTGFLGGIGGKIYTTQERQDYDTFRQEFLSKLLVARSGAAVTEPEYNRYAALVPESSSLNPLSTVNIFRSEQGSKTLSSIAESMKNQLDSVLNANQLSIYGYSKVNIDGKERTVGEILDVGGTKYRVLPDGNLTDII